MTSCRQVFHKLYSYHQEEHCLAYSIALDSSWAVELQQLLYVSLLLQLYASLPRVFVALATFSTEHKYQPSCCLRSSSFCFSAASRCRSNSLLRSSSASLDPVPGVSLFFNRVLKSVACASSCFAAICACLFFL